MRKLCWLLVFTLLLGSICPVTSVQGAEKAVVYEKEDFVENTFSDDSQGIIFNPLYEELINKDASTAYHKQLWEQSHSEESLYATTTPEFSKLEDALQYIRERMAARDGEISFRRSYNADFTTIPFDSIFDYWDGCSGQEGDALKWSWKSCSYAGTTYWFEYYTTAEQEQELTAKVNDILEDLDIEKAEDFRKIKSIYTYICDNVNYDYSYTQYTGYDALCTGTSVCQGYALAFYRLAKEVDLSVRIITSANHAWNIVKVGDVYYNVDATWDGQGDVTTYKWFMKNMADFPDHIREEEWETEEFHAQFPMAEDSWVDMLDIPKPLDADNWEVEYRTIDGSVVTTKAESKPKVLIFFDGDMDSSKSTIRDIANKNIKKADIIAFEIYDKTEEEMKSFVDTYGNETMHFVCDSQSRDLMWDYVDLVTSGGIYTPVVVYIDVNDKIQAVTNGKASGHMVNLYLEHYCKNTSIRITSQPESAQVFEGEKVVFNVAANGDGLSFQWQYSTDGSAWKNSGMDGAKTASLTVPATLARNGQKYRCVITDKYGSTVNSHVATLTVDEAPSKALELANTEIVLKTLDGGTATTSAEGRPKVLILFDANSYYGGRMMSEIAASDMQGADFLALEVCNASLEKVKEFATLYGSDNIVFSNDAKTMDAYWYYIKTVGMSTIMIPMIIYIDADDKVQAVAQGYCEAEEIKLYLNYYCDYNENGMYITGQPVSQTVNTGEKANFKVVASGNNLKYQWQYKAAGGSTWSNSGAEGAKTACLTIEGTTARNGQQYRCVITDGNGNSITSNAATLTVKKVLAITSQPTSQTISEGEKATFKVVASGSNLKYQWQFKASGSSEWKNSGMTGAKTASLMVEGTTARNGQQYRCVITDESGNSITSNVATLTVKMELAITGQPVSQTVSVGETATFKVAASGSNLKYQWQYKASGGTEWKNSGMTGAKTASLTVEGTTARSGQQYRCVVTDGTGNKVTSKAVTLTVKSVAATLVIVTNPFGKTVEEGESAVFKVVAQGEGLKYQWQFSKDKGKTWGNSGMTGAKTASLTVVGTAARNGQQYRCVVTDGAGNKVTSEAATLTVKAATVALSIIVNPTSMTVEAGEKVTFNVVAQGQELKYQWQFKTVGTSEWKNSGMDGAKTASLTVEGTKARNGQQYRCVITDGSGNQVISEVVTLNVE